MHPGRPWRSGAAPPQPLASLAGDRERGKKRTNAGRPLRRSSRVEVCCGPQLLRSAEWPSAAGFRYPAGSLTEQGRGDRVRTLLGAPEEAELEAVGLDCVSGQFVAEVRMGDRDQAPGSLAEALAEEFGNAVFGHDVSNV